MIGVGCESVNCDVLINQRAECGKQNVAHIASLLLMFYYHLWPKITMSQSYSCNTFRNLLRTFSLFLRTSLRTIYVCSRTFGICSIIFWLPFWPPFWPLVWPPLWPPSGHPLATNKVKSLRHVQCHWTSNVNWTNSMSANWENGLLLSYKSKKNRVIAQVLVVLDLQIFHIHL